MKIKNGVEVNGLRPEILLAIFIADGIWNKHGQELVITSCTDGKHGRGSKHYIGNAFDGRTRYFNEDEKHAILIELKNSLGEQYDVVLESDHMHIEFDPKV